MESIIFGLCLACVRLHDVVHKLSLLSHVRINRDKRRRSAFFLCCSKELAAAPMHAKERKVCSTPKDDSFVIVVGRHRWECGLDCIVAILILLRKM